MFQLDCPPNVGVSSCLPEAGQLSQSAHFSLQLPYTVLGLGRSANFLDHLFVGIPRQTGETVGQEDMSVGQSQELTHYVDLHLCNKPPGVYTFTLAWLFHREDAPLSNEPPDNEVTSVFPSRG